MDIPNQNENEENENEENENEEAENAVIPIQPQIMPAVPDDGGGQPDNVRNLQSTFLSRLLEQVTGALTEENHSSDFLPTVVLVGATMAVRSSPSSESEADINRGETCLVMVMKTLFQFQLNLMGLLCQRGHRNLVGTKSPSNFLGWIQQNCRA